MKHACKWMALLVLALVNACGGELDEVTPPGPVEVHMLPPMQAPPPAAATGSAPSDNKEDAGAPPVATRVDAAPADANVAPATTRLDAAAAPPIVTMQPAPFRFVGYGDSRSDHNMHQQIAKQIDAAKPELVLFSGDLEVSYSSSSLTTWLNIVRNAGPQLSMLLEAKRVFVARGNHDGGILADPRWKDLTRQSGGASTEKYAFAYKGVFFVTTGYSPGDYGFLENALKTPEAMAARWKIVWTHAPVYDSGTNHGINGIKATEDVCDRYGVDVFLSGHEHIYERSHQMRGGKVVDRGDALTGGIGTVYIVSGGGGAPLYGVKSPRLPSSHFAKAINNYCVFDVTDAGLSVSARDRTGAVIDQFTIKK
jgi:predicted phosphodiesterase